MSDDVGGIVLVHMSGLITPEIFAIEKFCQENGLFLLEDVDKLVTFLAGKFIVSCLFFSFTP